jgi:hypothetical protein
LCAGVISMKKHCITFILILLITILFDIGDLRCQDEVNMLNSQYQSEYLEKIPKDGSKEIIIDDKNVRVRMLEWIIKYNITKRYQQLDEEELEAILESRR